MTAEPTTRRVPSLLIAEANGVRVRTVDGGTLRLDGGAMFGVVPKPLWSRRIPADERNRIPLAMRCLLIETPEERILVDTGLGNKENEKFRDIYGVDNQPPVAAEGPGPPGAAEGLGGPTRLESSLRAAGVEPEDIDTVLSTHLHFDHAGGNTRRDADGSVRPAFPNARYLIRRGEWDFAHLDNERIRASYMPDNYDPLREEGRIEFVEEDGEILPGVSVLRTAGHTPHHQSVLVDAGGERLLYLADLVPTTAHVRLPWIMGYDIEPLVTLETKQRVLGRAAAEGWTLVFEHDPVVAWGRAVRPADGRPGCELADPVEDRESGR